MVSTQQGTRRGEGGIKIEGKERVGRGRGRERESGTDKCCYHNNSEVCHMPHDLILLLSRKFNFTIAIICNYICGSPG